MVDNTKVNKASDKGTGIRALKSEKIKGVDAVSYTHLHFFTDLATDFSFSTRKLIERERLMYFFHCGSILSFCCFILASDVSWNIEIIIAAVSAVESVLIYCQQNWYPNILTVSPS